MFMRTPADQTAWSAERHEWSPQYVALGDELLGSPRELERGLRSTERQSSTVTSARRSTSWRKSGFATIAGFSTLAAIGCWTTSSLLWLTPLSVTLEGKATDSDWEAMFRDFHDKYNKVDEYTAQSPEYYRRLDIFKANAIWIKEYNEKSMEISLAPNQFMDMDWNEFKRRQLTPSVLGSEWFNNNYTSRFDGSKMLEQNEPLPDRVNWLERNCVTPVKDQAHCGSCWAFSATGALEGAYCAQRNETINLSEQQLVDCARPEGTMGCHGGFMENAFQYVIDNGGICTEEAYPYLAIDNRECEAKKCKSMLKVKSIMEIPPHNDNALRSALANYGPVSVAIEADRPVFQFYHNGVMSLKCGKQLNHAVLAVGYDTDKSTSENYWLVKNSWGTTWGDEGYIRLTRDKRAKNGECGILLAPVLPIVDAS